MGSYKGTSEGNVERKAGDSSEVSDKVSRVEIAAGLLAMGTDMVTVSV